MLSILTKRLCPLMSLALAFGCGKKINDPETTTGNTRPGQEQELPSKLTLQIDETVSPIKLYEFPKNAWFKLPTKLFAKEGNAVGKKVTIYYNLRPTGAYEFLCTYRSVSHATELAFQKCNDMDGVEIISTPEVLASMDYPMDKGFSVKLQLTNPTGTGMKIESTYLVDWK